MRIGDFMVKKTVIKLPKNMPGFCPSDGTRLTKQPALVRDKNWKRVIVEGGLHCSTCNRRFFGLKDFEPLTTNPHNTRI